MQQDHRVFSPGYATYIANLFNNKSIKDSYSSMKLKILRPALAILILGACVPAFSQSKQADLRGYVLDRKAVRRCRMRMYGSPEPTSAP